MTNQIYQNKTLAFSSKRDNYIYKAGFAVPTWGIDHETFSDRLDSITRLAGGVRHSLGGRIFISAASAGADRAHICTIILRPCSIPGRSIPASGRLSALIPGLRPVLATRSVSLLESVSAAVLSLSFLSADGSARRGILRTKGHAALYGVLIQFLNDEVGVFNRHSCSLIFMASKSNRLFRSRSRA